MRDGPRLSDGVVAISPLGPDDFDAHLAGEDEALVRWLNGAPATPEGLVDYLRRCDEWWEASGPFHNFGIRVGSAGTLAGTVDVQHDQAYLKPRQVNIAYGLYPAWRGKGLATRSVLLACRYAAGLGFTEAVIRCEPGNAASSAVAERAGFAYRGRDLVVADVPLDWYVLGLDAITE
jgi:RimJ/RimL family protein N-acetyltransferase